MREKLRLGGPHYGVIEMWYLCSVRMARFTITPSASVRFDQGEMLIDKPGHYLTRGSYHADVYEIRGAYCIGWITLEDGSTKTGLWRIAHGAIMGGTPDDDLVEYVRPFDEPVIQ